MKKMERYENLNLKIEPLIHHCDKHGWVDDQAGTLRIGDWEKDVCFKCLVEFVEKIPLGRVTRYDKSEVENEKLHKKLHPKD